MTKIEHGPAICSLLDYTLKEIEETPVLSPDLSIEETEFMLALKILKKYDKKQVKDFEDKYSVVARKNLTGFLEKVCGVGIKELGDFVTEYWKPRRI